MLLMVDQDTQTVNCQIECQSSRKKSRYGCSELEIRYFETADSFLDSCDTFLSSREDLYHTIITLAQLVAAGSKALSPPYTFGAALQPDSVIGCFIHVNPDGLCFTELPKEAIVEILDSLGPSLEEMPRISAPPAVANAVVQELEKRRLPVQIQNETKWNLYRLDSIEEATLGPGTLRHAMAKDLDLITRWGELYQSEQPAPVDVPTYLIRKMKEKRLYLWEDCEPRSLVATSSPTKRGIKLTAVFTPPDERGKGYGSSAVAAACRICLAEDINFIVLSVIKDAGPEQLYRKLGFYKIGERHCHALTWQ